MLRLSHLVKKNTTMSVTMAIPRAFSLSLQVAKQLLSNATTFDVPILLQSHLLRITKLVVILVQACG